MQENPLSNSTVAELLAVAAETAKMPLQKALRRASRKAFLWEEGKRDRALLALLLACGLRRHEAVALRLDHLQQREEHWAIVDLVGKGSHVRTVPVPDWVRTELDDWLAQLELIEENCSAGSNKVGSHGEMA